MAKSTEGESIPKNYHMNIKLVEHGFQIMDFWKLKENSQSFHLKLQSRMLRIWTMFVWHTTELQVLY